MKDRSLDGLLSESHFRFTNLQYFPFIFHPTFFCQKAIAGKTHDEFRSRIWLAVSSWPAIMNRDQRQVDSSGDSGQTGCIVDVMQATTVGDLFHLATPSDAGNQIGEFARRHQIAMLQTGQPVGLVVRVDGPQSRPDRIHVSKPADKSKLPNRVAHQTST